MAIIIDEVRRKKLFAKKITFLGDLDCIGCAEDVQVVAVCSYHILNDKDEIIGQSEEEIRYIS